MRESNREFVRARRPNVEQPNGDGKCFGIINQSINQGIGSSIPLRSDEPLVNRILSYPQAFVNRKLPHDAHFARTVLF